MKGSDDEVKLNQMRENLIYRLREKSRKNIWHESRGKRSLYTEFIERINLLFN